MKKMKLLVAGLFILGGMVMVFSLNNNRETIKEREARVLQQKQEAIALYIVNNYENITQLDFKNVEQDIKTGYIDFWIRINSEFEIMVSDDFSSDGDYLITFFEHGSRFIDRTVSSVDLNNVTINYFHEDDYDK